MKRNNKCENTNVRIQQAFKRDKRREETLRQNGQDNPKDFRWSAKQQSVQMLSLHQCNCAEIAQTRNNQTTFTILQ